MKSFVYQKIYEQEESDWWYRALRKIIFSYIDRYSKVKSGKLLDVGCGTGYFMRLLSKNWDVYGFDTSKNAIKMSRSRGLKNIKLASVKKIPYNSNRFDVILVLDVIEHVEDDIESLREVNRVLKPGGIAIFNVPAFQFLWSSHDISAKHIRRYTKKELKYKLNRAGFYPLKITYINFFLFPIAFFHRMLSRVLNTNNEKTDVGSVPKTIQPLFYKIFSTEEKFLKIISFPFGVSVSAVVTKK